MRKSIVRSDPTRRIFLWAAPLLLCLAATAAADQPAGAGDGANPSSPPPNAVVETPAGNAQAATVGKPYHPRHFVDVYYGSAATADADVAASSRYAQSNCFLFCGPVSYSFYGGKTHFQTSPVYGVRTGKWLESRPAVGLAADFSRLTAKAPDVDIWYMPISFVVLARSSFLENDDVPEGRFQLYGGLMLSWVSGSIKVNGVGGDSHEVGYGALAGVALHLRSFAVFGEYRIMSARLKHDTTTSEFGNTLGGTTTSANVDLDTNQALFGVSHTY